LVSSQRFYHRHFFDTGAIVVADNVARMLFVAIFSWLIYAPGAGITSLIMSSSEQVKLTFAERAVLGFGIGLGVWHIVMLILGVLGLYYHLVMVGLCFLVLVASAWHFANVAIVGWRTLAIHFTELWQRRASPQSIGAAVIGRGSVAIAATRTLSRRWRRLLHALLLLLY
jgi:hypothetical protein